MMRSFCLTSLVGACAVALVAATPSAQTADSQLDRYTYGIRLYQSGGLEGAVSAVAGLSRSDLERVGRRVVLGPDRQLAEAAIVFHTEVAWVAIDQGSRAGIAELALAETLVRLMGPQPPSNLEFQQRWYALAASFYLGVTNPSAARLSVDRALKLFPENARLHMIDGAVNELAAHLLSPECVGPVCDSLITSTRSTVLTQRSFAEEKYRHALQLDPQLMEARLRLGRILFLRNKRQEARSELEAVTNSTKDSRLLYLAHLFLGGLNAFENDLPNAQREYEAAVTAAPDYTTAHIALSFVEQMLGHDAEARAALAAGAAKPVADPWRDYQNGGLDVDSLLWLRERVHR